MVESEQGRKQQSIYDIYIYMIYIYDIYIYIYIKYADFMTGNENLTVNLWFK